MRIPKNFIDPQAEREKLNYADPILSREGLILLVQQHDHKVKHKDLLSLYGDNDDKNKTLEYRLKAMFRDGQLVEIDGNVYTLDYWSLEKGLVVKSDTGDYAVYLVDRKKEYPLHRSKPDEIFEGDYGFFSFIEPLNRAAFVKLIEPAIVYLEGVVVDSNEYDLPEGYNYAIKVFKGPYKKDVISARSLSDEELSIKDKVYCRLDRSTDSEYILAEIIPNPYPKGLTSIIKQYGLPWYWPKEVLAEAKELQTRSIRKTKERIDLRDIPLVTIDGSTAKDFDDAVAAMPLDNNQWKLYVAIADVSHYVQEDAALDREASSRGVSVYFPLNVIPMLPEVLSNDLCSLKPHVDRYCLTCEMTIAADGKITEYDFYPAIMNSKARLTYEQVQEGLVPAELTTSISHLWEVYRALNAQRKREGYIHFAQQASVFDLDQKEKVKDISRYELHESNHLIEEMMLAANKCAARFIYKNSEIGVYRTHDEPAEQKVILLNAALKPLGLQLDMPYTLEKIADLSNKLKRLHPRLTVLISRIMQRATYETAPSMHFGLNFDLYSHFTSPIRRYPDLLVHRLIYWILDKKRHPKPTEQSIQLGLQRVNYLERRAEEAERSYHTYLKTEFASRLSGKNLTAMITGLTDFGVFVELDDFPIDGLVHVSQIDSSYWNYEQENGILTNGINTLKIGDKLIVKLLTIDSHQNRINFKIVNFL